MILENFIQRAISIHGNRYDYSKFVYVNAHTKGKILCKLHNIFFYQEPANHYRQNGCPQCRQISQRISIMSDNTEFISRAISIHGNRYDYSHFEYNGAHKKGIIVCKTHGEFKQTPDNHLHGRGCGKCTSKVSKPETSWLNGLNVPYRQYKLKTKEKSIVVDGYDPETNTVYQFHGDYWHGNPKIYSDPLSWNQRSKKYMSDLYVATVKTEEMIKNAGYNLVVVWESEYKNA